MNHRYFENNALTGKRELCKVTEQYSEDGEFTGMRFVVQNVLPFEETIIRIADKIKGLLGLERPTPIIESPSENLIVEPGQNV